MSKQSIYATAFTFTVNVTNDFQEDINVTLYVYNSSDAFVTSRQKTLINGTDLIGGEGLASLLVQLNKTGTYKFYWFAGNSSVNATTQNTTGPTVNSPFSSGSEAFSPLYGNPNQNYVFNVTMNSTAGVNITPTIYIVDGSNNVVYSGTGTTITNNNGVAYGTSTATVNITSTGNWQYFWNTSINGYGVRYPVDSSSYFTGAEVAEYYTRDFTVPANLSKLTASVTWSSLNSSHSLSIRLVDPSGNLTSQFDPGTSTRTKETYTVIPLPGLGNYNITRYEGLNRMSISTPTAGSWQLHVVNSEISQFEADIEFIGS